MKKLFKLIVSRGYIVTVSLIQIKIITYYFPPSNVALIFYLVAIFQLMNAIGAAPYGIYATRQILASLKNRNLRELVLSCLFSSLGFQLLVGTAIIIYTLYVENLNGLITAQLTFLGIASLIAVSSVKFLSDLTNTIGKTDMFVRIEMLNGTLQVFIPIIFIELWGVNAENWFWGSLIGSVFVFIFAARNLFKTQSGTLHVKNVLSELKHINNKKNYKNIFFPIILISITSWVEMHFHKVILSSYLSLDLLASVLIYQRVISQILNNSNTLLCLYFNPIIYQKIENNEVQRLNKILVLFSLLLIATGFLSTIISSSIVNILATDEYQLPYYLIVLLACLTTTTLLVKLSTYYFQLHRRFDISIKAVFMSLMIYLLGAVILILTRLPVELILVISLIAIIYRGIMFFKIIKEIGNESS